MATAAETRTVSVTLFKESGKYYTGESWRAPEGAIGPFDMINSPDFRRIGNGAVLIESDARTEFPGDENWGYPQLF